LENPKGEGRKDALRVDFNKKLKLEFHAVKVTSGAGSLAYREIDDVFGLTDTVACELSDNRTGKNTQHGIAASLRQPVYSRLAGYEDTNDAERLSVDHTTRHVVGERVEERTAASVSQMGRFETEILTQPRNLKALMKQLVYRTNVATLDGSQNARNLTHDRILHRNVKNRNDKVAG
jgi:hypothetical protein